MLLVITIYMLDFQKKINIYLLLMDSFLRRMFPKETVTVNQEKIRASKTTKHGVIAILQAVHLPTLILYSQIVQSQNPGSTMCLMLLSSQGKLNIFLMISTVTSILPEFQLFLSCYPQSQVTHRTDHTDWTTHVYFFYQMHMLVWFGAGMVFVFPQKLLLLKSTLCVRGENTHTGLA